jgi:hypothetical protein
MGIFHVAILVFLDGIDVCLQKVVHHPFKKPLNLTGDINMGDSSMPDHRLSGWWF